MPLTRSLSVWVALMCLWTWMSGVEYVEFAYKVAPMVRDVSELSSRLLRLSGFLRIEKVILILVSISFVRIFNWFMKLATEPMFHTVKTHSNLKLGMKFFLVSEACLFFSIFWRYVNSFISEDQYSRRFPNNRRIGIELIDGFRVPIVNTAVLITSRFHATFGYHGLKARIKHYFKTRFLISILLRVFFVKLQYKEYLDAKYTIMTRIYRAVFFLGTRFHRAHVIIRVSFLLWSLLRRSKGDIRNRRAVRLVSSIWYWHFVDVVWIRLYALFYVRNAAYF